MKATILSNREFTPLYHHLVLAVPHPSPSPSRGRVGEGVFSFSPGQFAMVGFGVLDPFLPRAFSIYRASHQPEAYSRQKRQKTAPEDGGQGSGIRGIVRLEFLYKVMGRGSTYLSTLKRGQTVEVRAPLGRGFTVPEGLETAILVAGGIGVPPIVALAEWMSHQPEAYSRQLKMVAFIGGKSREDVLCVQDFKKAGAEVHPVTEDGSIGQKGLVTDVLERYLLSVVRHPPSAIYACGPNAMLAAVADVAARYGLPCQVSMEATMACGFGICLGCAIKVKPSAGSLQPSASYKLCCKDGPVFEAGEIAW